MHKLAWITVFASFLLASPAAAAPADGFFVAKEACPAFQSFRNQTNPGSINVEPGRAYEIIEVNRAEDPSHYRMIIPGVTPRERWVAIDCGVRTVEATDLPPSTDDGTDTTDTSDSTDTNPVVPSESGADTYMLTASWQPGFCETKPDKVECVTQTEDRFDATNFSLHGLWPQPRGREYCVGVSAEDKQDDKDSRWRDLPAIDLLPATRAALDEVMPGTKSFLERHEWIVHGTCYNESMESYFSESIMLMSQLNATSLAGFMASNIDNSVTPDQIRAAVDAAFGVGAGDRVSVQCKKEQGGNRKVLTEIQIAIVGVIDVDSDLGALIMAAAPQNSNAGQCPTVIIDRAGL